MYAVEREHTVMKTEQLQDIHQIYDRKDMPVLWLPASIGKSIYYETALASCLCSTTTSNEKVVALALLAAL